MGTTFSYLLILAIPIVGGIIINFLFKKSKKDRVSVAMLKQEIERNHLNDATVNTNPNQNPPTNGNY